MRLRIADCGLRIAVVALALSGVQAFGQSSVEEALTNAPTTSLTNETLGVSTGTLIDGAGAQVKNVVIADYSFTKNFFAGAQVVNSTTAGSGMESAGVRIGAYKAMATTRLYGYGGGERNWSEGQWNGFAGVGIAYTPFSSQSNILANFSFTAEEQVLINTHNSGSPPQRTITAIRYSF